MAGLNARRGTNHGGDVQLIALSYQLEPRHVTSYQFAVRARLLKASRGPWWSHRVIQSLATLAAIVVASLAADAVTYAIRRTHLELVSTWVGWLIGFFSAILAQWIHYFANIHKAASPDGPTFSAHKMTLGDDSIVATSPKAEAHYRWSIFRELTTTTHIHVLWYEPGAGIVIPRSAFADEAADQAFCTYARERIAAAAQSAPAVTSPHTS